MELIIVPQKKGLTVNFLNLSTEVPSNTTFEWDFGEGNGVEIGKNPSYTYSNIGFYNVKVKAINLGSPIAEIELPLVITNVVKTSLSNSIYILIDNYMPSNIIKTFPYQMKRMFIEKWQLYIQPLVDHEVLLEDYNNELYYEALENQLIMEAASLDFLTVEFTNLLQSVSSSTTHIDEENPNPGEGIKRITTGPSEVEYFDPKETDKDIVSNITKAMQPGGFIETLRANLCTLATRLDIWLPFCDHVNNVVVPSITNKRRPVRYMGPNPTYPIKKGV